MLIEIFSVGYAVYLFVLATVLAWLEIQIEGKYGWAEKSPCWRPNQDSRIAKLYALIVAGKPMTGYHLTMFAFVFLILHFPFFAGSAWTIVKELEILSTCFIFSGCWDFLWFLWNPSYGLKRFKPQYIWWHKKWIAGKIPTDYPVGLIESLVLVLIAIPFGGLDVLAAWGLTVGILAGLTILSCPIARPLRKLASTVFNW